MTHSNAAVDRTVPDSCAFAESDINAVAADDGSIDLIRITDTAPPLSPTATTREAQLIFEACPWLAAIPVALDEGRLIGFLQRLDLLRSMERDRKPSSSANPTIQHLIDYDPIILDAHTSPTQLFVRLTRDKKVSQKQAFGVVDNRKLVGVGDYHDLSHLLALQLLRLTRKQEAHAA